MADKTNERPEPIRLVLEVHDFSETQLMGALEALVDRWAENGLPWPAQARAAAWLAMKYGPVLA